MCVIKKINKTTFLILLIIPLLIALLFISPLGQYISHQFFSSEKKSVLDSVTDIGINIPEGYSIHGIDVSRYQLEIDWERVASFSSEDFSVQFAFIKATEGQSLRDPNFSTNWGEAKRNKITCGAYHYFHANIDPVKQANLYSNTVKLNKGDLCPVLDVEEIQGAISKEELVQNCLIWLRLIERKYGVKPIVYTYAKFYDQYFVGTEIEKYPIWIAHYHVDEPETKARWHFWQHSDRANIDGIDGAVDANVFNGNPKDLQRFCLP